MIIISFINKYKVFKMVTGNEKACCFGLSSIVCYLIDFTVSILPLMRYNEFSETTCNVTSVDYPTELPLLNNTNHWKRCKCARSCKSWTPCIDIYVIVEDNPKIIYKAKENVNNIKNDCTFYNKKCGDNEDVIHLRDDLMEAKNTYNKYYNNTIKCYQDPISNIVILNNDYNWTTLIVLSVLIGLFTCFCVFCLVDIYKPDNRSDVY